MVLKVNILKKGAGEVVVILSGSLDSGTYSELEVKLKPVLGPMTKTLVLDMEKIEYISSMGVGVIFTAKKTIEAYGGSFAMIKLAPQIKMVFDIIKALPPVAVFETVDEADRYFAEMQKRVLEKGQNG